jgi:hypothetical protein
MSPRDGRPAVSETRASLSIVAGRMSRGDVPDPDPDSDPDSDLDETQKPRNPETRNLETKDS